MTKLFTTSQAQSSWLVKLTVAVVLAGVAQAACVDNTTNTQGLQNLLTEGGAGYTLSLCAGQVYAIDQSLNFTNTSQEISTEGYPTDSTRATLLVSGPKSSERNHTVAVLGDCGTCSFTRISHIQIDGNRGDRGEGTILPGGGNIEMGGANQGQIIENVKTFNPRGWSCLHIAEGPFTCSNTTIRSNDIGPCGSDNFQQWSDGISLSCADSLVENNHITDATDAGIVVFGSPGSTIRNNTIQATDRIMLGGINMVDFDPWQGNFSDLLVENNRIYGGFAETYGNDTVGVRNETAVVKIGMGIGPLVWWGDNRYGTNSSSGPATIVNNVFSGAMVFAITIAGARNFALQNNSIWGNTSFAGSLDVNCTTGGETPHGATAYLIDQTSNSTNITIDNIGDYQTAQNGSEAGGLTCFRVTDMPALDEYPYGPGFDWAALAANSTPTSTGTARPSASTGTAQPSSSSGSNAADKTARSALLVLPFGLLLSLGAAGLL